jgi:hypothetical protein
MLVMSPQSWQQGISQREIDDDPAGEKNRPSPPSFDLQHKSGAILQVGIGRGMRCAEAQLTGIIPAAMSAI